MTHDYQFTAQHKKMISHSEIINKPISIVWEHFLYKIEHPEHFVPGVSNVEIKEKTDDYVMREMDIQPRDGAKIRLLEKITYSPYWVKFLIVDHPVYSGHVDNLAEPVSEHETKITYSLYWTNKVTGEVFSNQEMIKNAVLKTVEFILESK